MSTGVLLDREEYIEQVYFYRTLRERIAANMPAQEILQAINEEILSTTRLPMAIEFLCSDLKMTGVLHKAFAMLAHYFTPFQAFVIKQAETDNAKFTMPIALLVLEREAHYRANNPTRPGLFVYQIETLSRNRLGYLDGLDAMAKDPFFDEPWRKYLSIVRRQIGSIDFADLIYLRSEFAVLEQRRINPAYEPTSPALFSEKEGKIAKASRGRDPLFLFAALQRQLGYPEVPRIKPRDDISTKLEIMQNKLRELEQRIRLAESELRGGIDLSKFAKPDALKDLVDDDL